ncbi:MAG: hypothetical protein WBZ51_18030 [Xanthobacteraceae bacterium]
MSAWRGRRCSGEEAALAPPGSECVKAIREQFERKTVWEGVVHVYALEGHPTASQRQPPDEVGEGGAGGVVKHPLPTIIVIDFPPTPLLPR